MPAPVNRASSPGMGSASASASASTSTSTSASTVATPRRPADSATLPITPSENESSTSGTPRCATPVCLVLGMAGSGKTTLVDALSAWLEDDDSAQTDEQTADDQPGAPNGAYVVNVDPAVHSLPYDPNVDIRDTFKHKDVMAEYSLGPNGAIITALNLYATRFDQVLDLVQRRAPDVRAVVFDTPGQIETFTWSASGAIITDALAMVLPTVVLYVVDTERSQSAMTFVSNMLYACSIMYKTGLPMVVVFNKVDVVSCQFAQAWMEDFDAFDAALKEHNFVGTLARSMAMALEEFYKNMRTVGVSAHTGEGMAELVEAVGEAAKEYDEEYRPLLEEKKRARAEEEEQRKRLQMRKLEGDLEEEDDVKRDRNTMWAPRSGGSSEEDEDAESEEEVDDAHGEKLKRMMGNAEDPAEKEAYEAFLKKWSGMNTGEG